MDTILDQDSILDSIKKSLGFEKNYTVFDADIIMAINSAFMTLQQLGVGPAKGFIISSAIDVWSSFSTDLTIFSAVKSYIYLKTKIIFDPPSSSYVLEALRKQAEELEWRLCSQTKEI